LFHTRSSSSRRSGCHAQRRRAFRLPSAKFKQLLLVTFCDFQKTGFL
jgi:hypothetical protein